MSRFVLERELEKERYEWGDVGWRCGPKVTGAAQLTVMDVTLDPGGGHAFHKHPEQEEMIIVKAGRVEQWIEREKTELGPGDSVYIDADVVHASFNDGTETARLQVVLGPCVGEVGYELVDVAAEEPWASLR
jgi:quercetin dioxygenase-like cupin family protein